MLKAISKTNGEVYPISQEEYDKYSSSWTLVVEEELSYQELKDQLTELEIPFKKNASKETLKKLLGVE